MKKQVKSSILKLAIDQKSRQLPIVLISHEIDDQLGCDTMFQLDHSDPFIGSMLTDSASSEATLFQLSYPEMLLQSPALWRLCNSPDGRGGQPLNISCYNIVGETFNSVRRCTSC